MLMIFASRKSRITCIAALLTLAYSQLSHAQVREQDVLGQPGEELTVKGQNILLALSDVAREYRIPIGLEMAPKGKGGQDKEIEVAVKQAALRDVLNAVVKQDPRYTWEIRDGVVNVYPRAQRDPLLKNLLETRVQKFAVRNNATLYGVRNSIVELPEIKSKLEEAKVTPFIIGITGVDFERLDKEFSLSISEVTLRELLNRLIRQSGVNFWLLNRYGENNEYLILNF